MATTTTTPQQPTPEAISKSRSPGYPAVGLTEAIQKTMKLYEKAQRTPVSDKLAVGAMGYGALSGSARVLLSALKKYGLIEDSGDNVRVSDLGLRIIVHPEGTEERNSGIRAAAFKPEIIKELAASHAHLDDKMFRAYLISQRKFSEAGADQFIPAFRDTLALVARIEGGYDADMIAPAPPPPATGTTPAPPSSMVTRQQQGRPLNVFIDDETSVEVRVLTGGNGTPLGLSADQLGELIEELSSLQKRLLVRKRDDA